MQTKKFYIPIIILFVLAACSFAVELLISFLAGTLMIDPGEGTQAIAGAIGILFSFAILLPTIALVLLFCIPVWILSGIFITKAKQACVSYTAPMTFSIICGMMCAYPIVLYAIALILNH